MANQNFIPWLEGKEQYSAQQNQYNNIYKNGFESGNLVKAEDFNAALRMTTLVCAGIASVFGFDNKTIDASEDTIAKAIQAANITLGDINANSITSKMGINTPSVTAAQVGASIINATTTITARGALSGGSLNINGTERIDSTGNIKNIASIDTTGSVRAGGVLEGNSLTINGVERINSDGNITGALVTVNEASMTRLGFTAGSNLVIDNNSNISANKIVSGTSIAANTININGTEMIDSSRNIKNVGTINTAGSITTSGNVDGANITASSNVNGTNITASKVLKGNSLIVTGTPKIDTDGNIDVNSVKVNGSIRINNAGNITGATVTSNGKLSGTFLNIGPLNGNVAAKVDINGNIEGKDITASGILKGNSLTIGTTERITSSGIVQPKCLNFFNVTNIATLKNSPNNNVEIKTDVGASSGNKEFGISTDSTVATNPGAYILLTVITVSRGNDFSVELSGIITAKDYHGDHIFHVYTGDGANVGSEWGTVRVSYQARSPYSEIPELAQGYVSYEQRTGSSTTIKVKMYPIAIFN